MEDIYKTEIEVITLVIVLRAIGLIAGSFSAGIILDKLPKLRYLILFISTCLMGIAIAFLPHINHLWAFFIVSVISTFGCGAIDTGGNVLCLDTWKDASGPYLHSIHFSFSVLINTNLMNINRYPMSKDHLSLENEERDQTI